jgi:putative membrane-bound dehydrogenase-like protein
MIVLIFFMFVRNIVFFFCAMNCILAAPVLTPSAEMPAFINKASPFRGKIIHPGYEGYTWVSYPHVENPGSLDIDPKGRIFVAEANRFKFGVQDLRGARYMIARDFQSKTLEDRLSLYQDFSDKIPMEWYTSVPERIIRLQDKDGNGVADERTVYSADFNETLDGIGFSLLAEEDAVYFTCIPALRKLTDPDDNGIADTNQKIVNGFGVRISFTGHDLHGIIRGPDGRLYFSVGDRGYHVTDDEGQVQGASGRGAVFRCESDGSNFEVVAHGLRNPQEIAFDHHGNLFTFDNNGDIGDEARIVYVIENADSGWDMSHQSAHQYVKDLDWGDFHLRKSVWVGEKMFEVFSKEQPQWVYPPADYLGNGPSGVAYVSGNTLPKDLQNSFLVTDYRGSPSKTEVIVAHLQTNGAGFKLKKQRTLINNVGVSDVVHGYDGNLYFADYGGGWSVNTNGSIQVIRSTKKGLRDKGKALAKLFADGFKHRSLIELKGFLGHSDQRVRQAAQFAMVAKGEASITQFEKVLEDKSSSLYTKLHALWGLGQLGRMSHSKLVEPIIVSSFENEEIEIRANVARVVGEIKLRSAIPNLIGLLSDPSPRVASLASIALGKAGLRGDASTVAALWKAVSLNTGSKFDVVLRHSFISALDRLVTPEQIISKSQSESVEQRLVSVILLRRRADSNLITFLTDPSLQIRKEAIRAIYDTSALDGLAGSQMAEIDPVGYPLYIQARIAGANFRLASDLSAKRLLSFCSNPKIEKEVRTFALHGLLRWGMALNTDPVLGHYRPMPSSLSSMGSLSTVIGEDLKTFLLQQEDPQLLSLATNLAQKAGLSMDPQILRKQISDPNLDPQVRVANLQGLAELEIEKDNPLLLALLKDKSEQVRATAFEYCLIRKLPEMEALGMKAVEQDTFLVAIKVMDILVSQNPKLMVSLWQKRELELRPELWLDLYLFLSNSDNAEAQKVSTTYAAGEPARIHALSVYGGDRLRGDKVFRNQGACMQCHQVDKEGGVQGPPLSLVGDRLDSNKLLESLVNPSAEISPGYGLSSITTNDGLSIVGRIAERSEDNSTMIVISPDGKETELSQSNVASITPPVSAMPPLGLTLSPLDLRDLIAYLRSRNKEDLLASKPKKKTNSGH